MGCREVRAPVALAGGPDSDSTFLPTLTDDPPRSGSHTRRTPMQGFWSDKRVTVTGGAGFLGQHLVRRLESFGAKVFVPRQRDYNLTTLDACLQVPARAPLRRPLPRRGLLRRHRDQRHRAGHALLHQPRHGRQPDGGRPAGEGRQVRRHRHRVQLSRLPRRATSRRTTSGPAPATPAWSTTA